MTVRKTKHPHAEARNTDVPVAVPRSRIGRILWIAAAVAFLTLLGVAVWVWGQHTGRGRVRPDVLPASPASVAAGEPALPTGLREWLGISDRSDCPDGETTDSAPADEPGTSAPIPDPPDDEIIYHGRHNGRREIALSFDDGPHPYYTPLILDILAEYNIRATFFMVGENVNYYPAAAEAVLSAGHEIGNHTFSHCKFNRMSEHEMREEISACEDAISSVGEYRPHFIRPPEGQMNDTMRRVIGALDYRIVLWDIDTRDWAHTPPQTICAQILSTVKEGDIILMHDFIGHDSPTPEALRLVIPRLLEEGYRFVTVGEMIDGDRG